MLKSKLRAKAPGLPPGTPVFAGHRRVEDSTIRLFDFGEDFLDEKDGVALEEVRGRAQTETMTWIDVVGLHDVALVSAVCEEYGLHALTVEDILNPRSRAKLEEFETYAFFNMKVAHLDLDKPSGLEQESVSVVLGEHYVLTFQETGQDAWDPVRQRVREGIGRIRRMGADYFAYALLDAVVDGYFVLLEQIFDRLQAIDDNLAAGELDATEARVLHDLRRMLLMLYKVVGPLRETVTSFERLPPALVNKEVHPFLRDVYDHTVQVAGDVELYRELADNLADVFQSRRSDRLNEATMLLSAIATVFLPLTFIVGVYGMNFDNMPELHWTFGYPLAWVVMISIAAALYAYFRRLDWF